MVTNTLTISPRSGAQNLTCTCPHCGDTRLPFIADDLWPDDPPVGDPAWTPPWEDWLYECQCCGIRWPGNLYGDLAKPEPDVLLRLLRDYWIVVRAIAAYHVFNHFEPRDELVSDRFVIFTYSGYYQEKM